jgi:anaerobic magnesium-protoporphyrin IX monomethyl ester cyclase
MIVLATPHLRYSPWGLYKPLMPLGLGFIAAMLERNGHDVIIVDNYLASYHRGYFDPTEFVENISQKDCEYIGIYTHTVATAEIVELVELARVHSKAKIVCGGPHATLLPYTLPDDVEYIVRGEGEYAFLHLIEDRLNSKFVNGKVIQYPYTEEMDELPMPAWHHFFDKEYQWQDEVYLLRPPFITMNTSRGCLFGCRFCSVPSVWRGYRHFSAKKIVDELKNLIHNYVINGSKIMSVYFREDNFTVSRKRVLDFCRFLLEYGLDIEWAAESRIDTLDEVLLGRMSQAGCRGLLIGVESGSQAVLDRIGKNIKVEQIREIFRICNKLGIRTNASMMYGIPGETEEDRVKSAELLEEIKPTFVETSVFVAIPFSDLYMELINNGEYEQMDPVTKLIYPKGYSELTRRYYGDRNTRVIM